MRKLKLAVGSEDDPGTEQDARAADWRGTDDGFVGDALEGGVRLDKSEEAELWVECAAGQIQSAGLSRDLNNGALLELAVAEERHHSQLPALPGCQKLPPLLVECPRDCGQVFNPLFVKQLFRRS